MYGYSRPSALVPDECAVIPGQQEGRTSATPSALEEGWPIATGVIEGAARWLVQLRMGHNGCKTWGLQGGRSDPEVSRSHCHGVTSNAYWRFHLRREHERIHHARYRDGLILAA